MKQNLTKRTKFVVIGALTLALAFAAPPSVDAAPKQKKSSKLEKKMRHTSPNDLVDVIISPTNGWTAALTRELNNKGSIKKRDFANFPFQVFRVKQKDLNSLSNHPDVGFITLDDTVKGLGHLTTTTGVNNVRGLLGNSTELDGRGVGIAIVDSGLDAGHVNLKNLNGGSRIVFSQDFTGENRTDDPYGHGTHVASIAAGNNLHARGEYEGVASGAHLLNLRVLNGLGKGTTSGILAALDWIYSNRLNTSYNIRVVNLSLGGNAIDSYVQDPVCRAVRKLVDAGIVVLAAAGNEGKDGDGNKIYGQIHSPGNEPSAITVGAVNTYGTDARTDDVVTSYSSRGPTRSFYTDESDVKHFDNLIKPDLVAPGNKIISGTS